MNDNHTYTVALRFHGDQLDPHEITRYLDLQPMTFKVSKGDRPAFWGYNGSEEVGFKDEWATLEEGLNFLSQHLLPFKDKIIKLSSEFNGTWWCGHFQNSFDGGPTLSPELLKEISDFNMPLFIDNYFNS